jgi:O-antigen/teichoic acid export membrane protein
MINRSNILLVFSVGVKMLAVVAGLFVNRWLNTNINTETLRDYNLILVYNALILGIVTLGIPELVQKFYTNHSDSSKYADFWTTITFLRVVLYVFSIFFIILTFRLSRTTELFLIISIFTAQYILLFDINFRSICDAFNKNWQFSLTDFVTKALLLLFLYIPIFGFDFQNTVAYFAFLSITVYLIQIALDWWLQRKYIGIGKVDFNILKFNFSRFFYLGVVGFAGGLYSLTDRWFLDFFEFDEFVIVGYSNAFKLIEISLIVPSLIIPVITSKAKRDFTNFIKNSDTELKSLQIYKFLFKYLLFSLVVGVGTSLGILFFGKFAILLIDPQRRFYDYSIESLNYLAFAIIPSGLISFTANMNVFLDAEKYEFIGILIITVSVISLYLYLIPIYGHIGAALSSLIGNAVIFLVKLFFFNVAIHDHAKIPNLGKTG